MGTTRALLAGGALAGPLFLAVVAIQELTRPGLDPRHHPLSLLSLGDLGWIQIANFVLAGLLNLGFAAGLWRASRRAPAGPLLIAGYGLGLIVAGVFVRDPGAGYPPGSADPADPSWHHILHGVGAVGAFGSLIAACGVFARRFAGWGERGWAGYCAGTGAAVLALIAASRVEKWESVILHAAALVGWTGVSAIAVRLLMTTGKDWPCPPR